MCGGKGGSGGTSPTFSQPSPITTQQNINQATQQQQQYQANPLIQQYIQQALGQAGGAAASPFNMPVQPIAGFTPLQQQYFGQIAGMQGMTDPYFNQAANMMNLGSGNVNKAIQSIAQAQQGMGAAQGLMGAGYGRIGAAGAPVTTGDIQDYLNPYADATLANMKKYVFDPQRTQMMGQQTQMAGGVGADRLALASQNIDKTQADAIAAAQAGFWQPAMSMAEQQKQMALQSGLGMGTIGQGIGGLAAGQGQLGASRGQLGLGWGGLGGQYGGLGTAAQQAALQASGALGGAGTQQQRLSQAQLDAQYRQAMAGQAYPFQTAQFLAGISGGLAPALGGTTSGAGFTSGAGLGTQMPSQPAWGSQLFGGLAAGAGLLGSLGAFDSSGKGGTPDYGSLYDPLGGGSDTAIYKRGGRTLQRGGAVDSLTEPPPLEDTPPGPVPNPFIGGNVQPGLVPGGYRIYDYQANDPAIAGTFTDPQAWLDVGGSQSAWDQRTQPSPFIGGNVKPGLVPGGYRIYDYQANDPAIAGTFTDKQAWLDMGGSQEAWDKRIVPAGPAGSTPSQSQASDGGGPGAFGGSFWPDPKNLIFKNFGPTSPTIPNVPKTNISPQTLRSPFAVGGDIEDEDVSIEEKPITAAEPSGLNIPSIRLPMGSGAQTGAKLDLSPGVQFPLPWTMQQQQAAGTSGSGGSGGIGGIISGGLKLATTILPYMLAARGGVVNPFDAGRSFQEGGGTDDPFDVDQPHLGFGDVMSAAKKYYSPMVESFGQAIAPPAEDPIKGIIPRMIGGMRSAPAAPAAPAAIAPGAFKMPESAPAMPSERPTEASLTDPSARLPDVYRATHSELTKAYGPQVASAITANLGVESPSLNPAESHDRGTGIGLAGWRDERRDALYDFAGERRLDPLDRRTQLAFLQHEIGTNPQYSDMLKRMQAARSPAEAARIFRMEYERPAGTTQGRPLGLNQAQQLATQFHAGNFSNVGAGGGPSYERPAFADYQPSSVLDRYGPGQREQDWGQRAARSPWLSLVSAGAAMMTAPGNLGSAIGYGLDAGAKTLQAQRKALDSEDLVQQKADMLTERADQHLREYQRKSEYADIRTRIAEEREARLREKETRIKEHAPMAYKDALREARENNPGLLGNPDALHEAALEIMRRDPARTGTTAPTGTPVGTKKKFKSGEFEKINTGPDSDASTWRKVGT